MFGLRAIFEMPRSHKKDLMMIDSFLSQRGGHREGNHGKRSTV